MTITILYIGSFMGFWIPSKFSGWFSQFFKESLGATCKVSKLTIWYICHIMKGERMTEFEVIFYEKENGEKPVEEFLLGLDVKMRSKMIGLLEILQERGNQLREPYSKHLEDGIFEVRCQSGSDITRILYFFYYRGNIVLTNGFVKKTQKTPRKEIELAKKRRADYVERMD